MLDLVDTTAARIKRAWAEMLRMLRTANTVEGIAQRRAENRPVIVGTRSAAQWFAAVQQKAYVAAGEATAASLSTPASVRKKLLSFSANDPPAVAWAQANELDKIVGITEDQRLAIHAIEVRAARTSTNPLAVAREIRDVIGLTPAQLEMVDSYRASLESGQYQAALDRQLSSAVSDRTIASAAARDIELTPAQIDTAVERYRTNAIAMRAETIARTEGLRVAHQGSQETIRQAIGRGDVDAEQIVRTWNHHPGKRGEYDREFHVSMHGNTAGWDEPFISGLGNALMYPGDPDAPAREVIRCGCVVTVRIRPGPR